MNIITVTRQPIIDSNMAATTTEELSKSNLNIFLKDGAFVEYLNAFLLLPSFPCHVYYDEHTSAFESVDNPPHNTRPSSVSTVYLSESQLTQLCNPLLCQEWVCTQRLPLFITSDLYSEYKLLKILTNSASLFFETCQTSRPASTRRGQRRPSRYSLVSARKSSTGRRKRSTSSQPTAADRKVWLLKSKAGLDMFRKFLNGKMGEENFEFWIKVEGLRNVNTSTEYISGLKQLRVKYPNEFRIEGVATEGMQNKTNTLNQLQHMSINNLKQYWYPQFLSSVMKGDHIPSTISLPSLAPPTTAHSLYERLPHTPTYRKLSKTRSSHEIGHTPHSSSQVTSMPRLPEPRQTHSSGDPAPYNRRLGLAQARPNGTRYSMSSEGFRRPLESARDSKERCSALAKYNTYPLPLSGRSSSIPACCDPPRPPSPIHAPSSPQILSVSGTPVPMETTAKIDYKPLLRCLSLEQRKAGGYFQKHLELMPDEKVSINCLFFWREVQEYKGLFINSSFSTSAVEMKAKVIHGRYIYKGSMRWISCPSLVAEAVFSRLWPPYEDLFDGAEEHALSVLLRQWEALCEMEGQIFESLSRADEYSMSVNELGELREESDSCCSSYSSSASIGSSYLESEDEDGVHDDEAIPSPHADTQDKAGNEGTGEVEDKTVVKEMAFNDLITNTKEMEYFKMYLNDNKGAIHLMCWMEIEALRSIPATDKAVRNLKAKQLRKKYFTKSYFFGSNSPASKEQQRQVVGVGGSIKLPTRPLTPVFREAQKHIRLKVEQFVRSFVKSDEFMERVHGRKSAKSKGNTENTLGNDALTTRHVESHETILLRKMLSNEASRRLFQYYMNTQTAMGSCPAGKQVDFWLEVQRFKAMFHSQMNEKLLQDKMRAILLCYFQSQSPPRLQLNIPSKIAEETIKKKFGPYIFRESQNAVFKNIQSYWNEYQNFLDDSNNVTSIEAAIGELKKQIEEERVRMKEMENTEQIEQERSKLSMPRFETIEEKKQRLKREQETKEFGEVAVSFRLSQLNPNFKFYFNDNGSTSAPELASEWISTLKSTSKVRKTVHYEQYSN